MFIKKYFSFFGGISIKRILIINVETQFGGAEKSIVDIFKKISEKEEYEVLFLVENSKMKNILNKENIKFKVISLGKLNKNIVGISKLLYGNLLVFIEILQYKPHIVFSNTDISHMISFLSCFLTNIPFILILRDYRFKKIAKTLLEPFVKNIVCVSEHLKNFYKGGNKYEVIPNGIIVNDIINSQYRLIYRHKYAKNNEIIYGVAARFARWKGLDKLIKAFNLANKNINNFNAKLLIAGSAQESTEQYNYYLELKELIKKLGIEDKVSFIGWIEDPLEFFYNCDVIISSSITKYGGPESFGRTIIEAWSVKKPVITTNCGGPSYIVEDGKTGLKVNEENLIVEMKNAILELYKSKKKRKKIGNEGFRRVSDTYNIDKVIQNYLKLIKYNSL
ncbi:glycosyltransferase family 4 protein [Halothermothrix orenii]|uniref:Glycosyl transferase group 1 n=1 Tax=Halothermothrix orenii (strain H 168 / OCM 544 / DSM 9562) TaxID=373903 RepID=B8D175_HALOH|nr:glycosyltransferase family 4 protein [Halothermothrix orenii]ACL71027.1 glycosyl transferase group 1 [Halothermothrix orenii H 168]